MSPTLYWGSGSPPSWRATWAWPRTSRRRPSSRPSSGGRRRASRRPRSPVATRELGPPRDALVELTHDRRQLFLQVAEVIVVHHGISGASSGRRRGAGCESSAREARARLPPPRWNQRRRSARPSPRAAGPSRSASTARVATAAGARPRLVHRATRCAQTGRGTLRLATRTPSGGRLRRYRRTRHTRRRPICAWWC